MVEQQLPLQQEPLEAIGPETPLVSPELPPTPPAETRTEPRHWLKRTAGTLALVGSLTGIVTQPSLRVAASRSAAEYVYEHTPLGYADQAFTAVIDHEAGYDVPTYTTFQAYSDPEHPTPKDAKVTNFVFTGLGEMHGEEIAKNISRSTDYKYPARYQENGNQPIDADYMAHQLIKSIEEQPLNTRYIGFTCHSMGFEMLPETLNQVKKLGLEDKLPKIAFINMLSSPSGMQTADFGATGDFLTKTDIGQGPVGRLVANSFGAWRDQGYSLKGLNHDINWAWDSLTQGASYQLIRSQMLALDKVNSKQALENLVAPLKGMFLKHAKITYFGSDPRWGDQTVNDGQAWSEIDDVFNKVLGVNVDYFGNGNSHANYNFPRNAAAPVNRKLRETMAPPPSPSPSPAPVDLAGAAPQSSTGNGG